MLATALAAGSVVLGLIEGVADATPPYIRGYTYGFQRASDNGGAVAGALAVGVSST